MRASGAADFVTAAPDAMVSRGVSSRDPNEKALAMARSEVVVIFAQEEGVEAAMDPFAFGLESESPDALAGVLDEFGAELRPILQPLPPVAEVDGGGMAMAMSSPATSRLAHFYRTEVEPDSAEALAARLRALPQVEAAYVTPPTENPVAPFDGAARRAAALSAPQAAGPIADYEPLQTYLDAAPGGVDARAAWAAEQQWGRGNGVTVIDIEGGWCLGHVDLQPNGGLLSASAFTERDWQDHGTAVMGEIIGRDNGFGVIGIAPDADMAVLSHHNIGSAAAIQQAAARLRPGDLLLLEMHRPGPRHNFATRRDQLGYIAVEWWEQDFLAIRIAVERGIIVVEAAGNGAENLDDRLYDTPFPGFSRRWRNPFRGAADSGAILVGAGCPPSGAYGPDRSRLDFSNHGSRLDCQGFGAGVVTTGYGDLHKGPREEEDYTAEFAGTSSASPIVTGALACLQGIARAHSNPLTPARARQLLRTTGSPQQASASAPVTQRIGARPDLAQLIHQV